ncbi:1-phosphofructokinase [Sporanaerobium hydrogeniformans]|uniref:1-phosphofructokinase n=1 Tax=Sporanaerobium hydrogeniformans TaxID=3072179 RepID=A0AC61DK82_9FIRM|nr:1-phosphofructokinase [Sporanaerobium hydrogeniformans]PHV72137.1 1-phosphofructokinase [Sporanaerobium hydrogeniformans]
MITTVTLNVAIDKLYTVEDYKPYEVMRVKECTATPGGKGLNVTKVIQLLKEEVIATGFVGGHAGDWVLERLDERGISHQFVKVEAETRTCINIKDLLNGRHTEFLEPGFTLNAHEEARFIEKFKELLKTSEVVTLSGSIPKGIRATIYNELVDIAKKAGRKVIVDTSGNLLVEILKSKPTMIKPNRDELEAITKKKLQSLEEIAGVAKELQVAGIPIVAISLGKEGVLVVCEEGTYQGKPPVIEAVNTVGCGDSMIAGFAVGLVKGEAIEEIIKRAVAVSAANALTAATGSFEQADYERLLDQVTVKRWAD